MNVERVKRRWIFAMVISITVAQRLVLPAGGFQIPLGVFFILAFLFFTILRGSTRLHPIRLMLFVLAMGGTVGASIAAGGALSSLVYLLILYLPFVFVRGDRAEETRVLQLFSKVMFWCAFLGIGQFFLQVAGIPYVDVLGLFVPQPFLHQGFHTSIPVVWDASLFKSNGVFFLEPSWFSRQLALALIVDLILAQRGHSKVNMFRAGVMGTAMLLSFSGTGLVLLILVAPLILLRSERLHLARLLPAFLALGVVLALFANSDYGSFLFDRTSELNSPDKSGYKRFVAPYLVFRDYAESGSIFGVGAGGVHAIEEQTGSYASTFVKVFVEYGPFGLFLFTPFILHAFFARKRSKALGFALFVNYAFLTGALLQPQTILLSYMLGMMHEPVMARARRTVVTPEAAGFTLPKPQPLELGTETRYMEAT